MIGSSAHMRFDESAFDGSNLLWGSVTELIDNDAIKDLASEVGLQMVEGPLENLPDDEMISLGDDADTESDSESVGESVDVPDSVSNSDDDVNARPQGYVENPQQCSLLNLQTAQAVRHVNAAIQKVQDDIALQDAAFAADYVSLCCYLQCLVANADDLVKLPDPLTYAKAKKCEDWDGWDNPVDGAIKSEMDSMRWGLSINLRSGKALVCLSLRISPTTAIFRFELRGIIRQIRF